KGQGSTITPSGCLLGKKLGSDAFIRLFMHCIFRQRVDGRQVSSRFSDKAFCNSSQAWQAAGIKQVARAGCRVSKNAGRTSPGISRIAPRPKRGDL
ncbi:hypothetical protein, partial [Roseibium sp. RKSG952]|uniref:hypothetical protein n=1 Tax=Roseibium sp. RKSG952 TaxID=2529384 RepID=UPI001AD8BCD1